MPENQHYACFKCRKDFKAPPGCGPSKCPDCGAEVWLMGTAFKPPKEHETKKWKIIKKLRSKRHIFYRDCSSKMPTSNYEADRYIQNNKRKSWGEVVMSWFGQKKIGPNKYEKRR